MNESARQMSNFFQSSCDKYDKLFLPDATRDEGLLNNLIGYFKKHQDRKTLEACIDYFCKHSTEPVLVMDFALQSREVLDKVVEDRESRKEFNDLLAQTQQHMKEQRELRDRSN